MSLNDHNLQNAALALYDDLRSNGCQAVATASVSSFQSAYNAAGNSPHLAVDGLYGKNSSAALQAVMTAATNNSALDGQQAPAGCVTQGGNGGGSLPPIIVPGSVPSTSGSALPWILGGLVLTAGAFAAYTYSKKHHRK
jgi:hypothetical protein